MDIRFENLTYRYDRHLFRATSYGVKDLNLEIKSGEAFGFLGSNGAGKTTSIKCLMGLQIPTKGGVFINNINSRIPSSRKKVGFLPEYPYFYQHLTVKELLLLYGSLIGTKKIDHLLDMLGLSERRDQKLRNLSKGLIQRVGLAQALLGEPELLVLDEPFSGLDPVGRKQFRDIFLDLNKKGVTLFISSHILTDVESICSRASILVKGELKAVVDLRNRKSIKSVEVTLRGEYEGGEKLPSGCVRFRLSSIDEANQFIQGKTVESVVPEYESLEDIFLSVNR
jgi:ABC-2 type transport system ATP-binding protein